MSVSVQRVISRALDWVGLNNSVGAPSPDNQALAVDMLNGLLGEWSSKRWINPNLGAWTCVPANNDRVILSADPAVTADISVDLLYIDQVTAERGQIVYPLRKIQLSEYERISVKTVTAIPAMWAWDAQLPTSNIWLFPRVSPGDVMRIVGVPRIPATVSQSTIQLDDAYFLPLASNLAVLLYDFYPRDAGISTVLLRTAETSLEGLKARVAERDNGAVECGYSLGRNRSSYWTSPLNTVTH